MTRSTSLIVLHTTKFAENSVIAHTLSKEYGRRGFVVRNAGRRTTSVLLPLNILEAEVVESGRTNLFSVRRLVPSCPLTGIRDNVYKNAITMFISEVLYRVVKEGTSEQRLYDWCEKQIHLLDAVRSDFSNFHICFLLELTVVLGFSPKPDDLRPFTGDEHDIVERFMVSPFAESMLIPLTGAVRNKICEDVLRYIEYHTESTLTINSLKVLREIFV